MRRTVERVLGQDAAGNLDDGFRRISLVPPVPVKVA